MPPVSSLPEEQSLVAAARRQEPAAWDRLLASYQAPLHAYVAELIRDPTAAQDLVQESFRRAVKHIAGLREEGRFGSWLFGIAHQQCLQYFRKDRRHRERFAESLEPLEEPVDEGVADPCSHLMRQEEAEAFFVLMERLPAAQRSVLLLHILEDFSLEEIAVIMAVPVGTVKSRLHHAKRAVRTLVEDTK
jgi:RNA polymerase sigma-70 factor (ECF subfamily)